MLDCVVSDGQNLPSEAAPELQTCEPGWKCISSLLFLKLQEDAAKKKRWDEPPMGVLVEG